MLICEIPPVVWYYILFSILLESGRSCPLFKTVSPCQVKRHWNSSSDTCTGFWWYKLKKKKSLLISARFLIPADSVIGFFWICSCISFSLALLRDLGATLGLERLGCEDDLCTFSGKPVISKQKRLALPTVSASVRQELSRVWGLGRLQLSSLKSLYFRIWEYHSFLNKDLIFDSESWQDWKLLLQFSLQDQILSLTFS